MVKGAFTSRVRWGWLLPMALLFLLGCTSYSENTMFNQPVPPKSLCTAGDTACLSSLSDPSSLSIQIKGKNPYFYDVNIYKERIGTPEGSSYAFCMDVGEEFLVMNGECYISNFTRSEIYYYFKNGNVVMGSNDPSSGGAYDGQKAMSCKDGRFVFPLAIAPLLPPKTGSWAAIQGVQAFTNVPYILEVKMKVWDLDNQEIPTSLNMTHKVEVLGNILFTNLTCFDSIAAASPPGCTRVCSPPN